ncbi:piggyBac transposable element-derived 4-like [Brachionus plicatilis]|uniref:PiggyBac transposable element-derived 4-like n=1 Tax=Brachionus plicatilis TaxID=10195 RepID=A0A3M7QQG5_BRAPC|nr:piggyBac transposable element-derived 4-like [Brachionus plicatilis]
MFDVIFNFMLSTWALFVFSNDPLIKNFEKYQTIILKYSLAKKISSSSELILQSSPSESLSSDSFPLRVLVFLKINKDITLKDGEETSLRKKINFNEKVGATSYATRQINETKLSAFFIIFDLPMISFILNCTNFHAKAADPQVSFTKEDILAFIGRKDKNVAVFSSFHEKLFTISEHERKLPNVTDTYNKTKVGVDCVDNMTRLYSVKTKTRRWPVAVFIEEKYTEMKKIKKLLFCSKYLRCRLISSSCLIRFIIFNLAFTRSFLLIRLRLFESPPTDNIFLTSASILSFIQLFLIFKSISSAGFFTFVYFSKIKISDVMETNRTLIMTNRTFNIWSLSRGEGFYLNLDIIFFENLN